MGSRNSIVSAYVFIERDTEVSYGVRTEGDQVVVRIGPYGEFEIVLDREGLDRWDGVIAEARVALDRAEEEMEADGGE